MNTSTTLRHRRESGPYARGADPLDDARHALEAGIPPARVVPLLLPIALRRYRVGALRRVLADYGAAGAFDMALDAYLVQAGRRAAA